ncbi:MAG: hypothetical protein Q9164_000495 [Protoblastenia rupestris]
MNALKAVPLTCHGHSRPVTHLSFSDVADDGQYYILSACKGVYRLYLCGYGSKLRSERFGILILANAFIPSNIPTSSVLSRFPISLALKSLLPAASTKNS